MNTSTWDKSEELKQKLAALQKLADSGVLRDRSTQYELTVIGIIE